MIKYIIIITPHYTLYLKLLIWILLIVITYWINLKLKIFAWPPPPPPPPPPPQTPGLKNISLMQNTHMALVPKTTVVHCGWSCHSKQTFWRGVLESHCAVIIRNESIVDRVSFPATVEIFQMAVFVCYSALTVTLWEPLKWVHVSSRLVPLRRGPAGRTIYRDARRCTCARQQHACWSRLFCHSSSAHLIASSSGNLPRWDTKSLHFQ